MQEEVRLELELVDAEVNEVRRLGFGSMVYIDLETAQHPREGMLVGCYAHFMFLVEGSPSVDTRYARINAGAISSYTLQKPGSTKYLSELRGSEVLLVDAEGRTRKSYATELKIERNPMIMITALYENKNGTTISQDTETVRIVSPDGSLSVTKIKPGDKVKAYVTEPVGMHFGRAVKEESIMEK